MCIYVHYRLAFPPEWPPYAPGGHNQPIAQLRQMFITHFAAALWRLCVRTLPGCGFAFAADTQVTLDRKHSTISRQIPATTVTSISLDSFLRPRFLDSWFPNLTMSPSPLSYLRKHSSSNDLLPLRRHQNQRRATQGLDHISPPFPRFPPVDCSVAAVQPRWQLL
jgi:hypothetical protein